MSLVPDNLTLEIFENSDMSILLCENTYKLCNKIESKMKNINLDFSKIINLKILILPNDRHITDDDLLNLTNITTFKFTSY